MIQLKLNWSHLMRILKPGRGHVQGSRSKARTRMKMTVTPPWVCTGIGGTHHWVQWLPNIFCGTIELILQFHLSIIYYHNQERARKIHTVRNGEYILGKCHTIIRPCLSSTVLGSSKCPNWGLIKNLASSAVSSSPSGWGRLFFTRSAIRVTSHSVWSVPNKY